MSTFTKFTNPITRSVAAVYAFVVSLVYQWRAHARKRRSLYELERLDDYLLEDIGLTREKDQIVPIRVAPIAQAQLYSVQESQLRRRARTHKRERHRHLRRRAS